MSQLTDVFSAGFHSFLLKKGTDKDLAYSSNYKLLYNKYMGVTMPCPDELLGNGFSIPKWPNEELFNSLLNRIKDDQKLRIGTYPHAPYYYADDVDFFDVRGFEYEMARAIADEIVAHYGWEKLDLEWVEVNVELDGDGTENTAIVNELNAQLGISYDLVFSGVFKGSDSLGTSESTEKNQPSSAVEADQDPIFLDYAASTNLFYISALYTGRGDFGVPPTADLEATCEWFAQNSSEEEPIRITHTTNGNQSLSGEVIENKIREYGGYTTRRGLLIEDIEVAIADKVTHIYAGDLMQIQRLCMEDHFPYDLNVNVLYDLQGDASIREFAPYALMDTEK